MKNELHTKTTLNEHQVSLIHDLTRAGWDVTTIVTVFDYPDYEVSRIVNKAKW